MLQCSLYTMIYPQVETLLMMLKFYMMFSRAPSFPSYIITQQSAYDNLKKKAVFCM